MKKSTFVFLTLVFYVSFVHTYAQTDSIKYYRNIYNLNDKTYFKFASKDSANYYTIPSNNDSINGIVSVYYIGGQKMWESNYVNKKKDGRETQWHENGNKSSEGNYTFGKKNGSHYYYPEDTNYYYIDEYKDGNFIIGKKFDNLNNQILEYNKIYEASSFVGGRDKMSQFLTSNLKYPRSEERLKIEGKVYIQFYIDEKGNVCDAKVVKSLSPNIDAEALRVINLMPKWNPTFRRGEYVKEKMAAIPIHFKLP